MALLSGREFGAAFALLVVTLGACILPDYESDLGGTSAGAGGVGAGGAGAGGTSVGAGGTGGDPAGGTGGTGAQAGAGCPDTDFGGVFGDSSLGSDMHQLPDGFTSSETGRTVVAGVFTEPFDFGGDAVAGVEGAMSLGGLFIGSFLRDGSPDWHVRVGGTSSLKLDRVIEVSDGALVLFHDTPNVLNQPLTIGSDQFPMQGGADGFAVKVSIEGAVEWVHHLSNAGTARFTSAVEAPAGVLLVGWVAGVVDLEGFQRHSSTDAAPMFAWIGDDGALEHYQQWEVDGSNAYFNDAIVEDTMIIVTGAYRGPNPLHPPLEPPNPAKFTTFLSRIPAPSQPMDVDGSESISFTHADRINYGSRLAHGNAGVLVAGHAEQGATTEFVFGTNLISIPATSDVHSYVALVDVNSGTWGAQWGTIVRRINSPAYSGISSFGLLPTSEHILLGHAHAPNSGTTVNGQNIVAPSLFLGLDPAGGSAELGALLGTTNELYFLRMLPNDCGTLMIGSYQGDRVIEGITLPGNGMLNRNGVVFLQGGIPFTPL